MVSQTLERVVVIGSSCSGKTTFASALARALRCPCFDLDPLYHGPNWSIKPLAQFRELVAHAAMPAHWVASGNYADVRDILWSRATTIIWLDYGYGTVLWRALRRTFRRSLLRQELWHGNRESFRMSFFSRDSVLLYVATTFHQRRRSTLALRAGSEFAHLAWIRFTHPKDAENYLASIKAVQ